MFSKGNYFWESRCSSFIYLFSIASQKSSVLTYLFLVIYLKAAKRKEFFFCLCHVACLWKKAFFHVVKVKAIVFLLTDQFMTTVFIQKKQNNCWSSLLQSYCTVEFFYMFVHRMRSRWTNYVCGFSISPSPPLPCPLLFMSGSFLRTWQGIQKIIIFIWSLG